MPNGNDEPDGNPCPCSWMDKAKAIVLVMGATGGLLTGVIAAYYSHANHEQSAEHFQKSDKSRQEIERSAGPNLQASWKYLQDIADSDQKNKLAQESAKNARQVYEAWLAQQREKP